MKKKTKKHVYSPRSTRIVSECCCCGLKSIRIRHSIPTGFALNNHETIIPYTDSRNTIIYQNDIILLCFALSTPGKCTFSVSLQMVWDAVPHARTLWIHWLRLFSIAIFTNTNTAPHKYRQSVKRLYTAPWQHNLLVWCFNMKLLGFKFEIDSIIQFKMSRNCVIWDNI